MKLSASNIAWTSEQDETVYALMNAYGFTGLEIAPTRIFPDAPYEHLEEAAQWAGRLQGKYGFEIASMQSIWYGRTENIFGTAAERSALTAYTKKAIDFAAATGCRNLVFGCPRNRNIPAGRSPEVAVSFFKEIGGYAAEKGTVIGMEANPPIYNTNYINDTASALQLIKDVGSPGFRLNLDVGTMLHNGENMEMLRGKVHLINHVHISEPGLKPITERPLHRALCRLLKEECYGRFVSIEMGKIDSTEEMQKIFAYMGSVFCR